MTETFGKDLGSATFWEGEAGAYSEQMDSSRARYHRGRLDTANRLLQELDLGPGTRILDFGCGTGDHTRELEAMGFEVDGMDIAEAMIEIARDAGGKGSYDVGAAADIGGSYDAIITLNVLAYLTDEEHETFWARAREVLPVGGHVLASHSNELFDVFALNGGTERFFAEHLTDGESVGELLTEESQAGQTYNVRANPLSYDDELRGWSFEEVGRAFFNYHRLPPALLGDGFDDGRVVDPGQIAAIPEWKRMLQCSTYFSLARRSG